MGCRLHAFRLGIEPVTEVGVLSRNRAQAGAPTNGATRGAERPEKPAQSSSCCHSPGGGSLPQKTGLANLSRLHPSPNRRCLSLVVAIRVLVRDAKRVP